MKRMTTGLLVTAAGALALTTAHTAYAAPEQNLMHVLPSPVTDSDYGYASEAKVTLGKFLFFDKILSGNRNTSCATCHHALTDTGDGLSLPIGEGARGLGVARNTGTGAAAVHERVPRNAPHIFNLGAKEFTTMFHDGRVAQDPSQPSGFLTPAGDKTPFGLDSALAAQAMFPVTSPTEMAGQAGENKVADAAAAGNLADPRGVWDLLAKRLRRNPEYVALFKAAYPGEITRPKDITFVHAANAIAAFEAAAGRADNSPFDRFLRGSRQALSLEAKRGMKLFYGKAGCASCHSGKFQTDHGFYAIAMPQIGPGKGDGVDGHEDFGRERVTGDPLDRYRFRTPSLRNVELTGPWGHDGAYNSLRGVVEHHLNPVDGIHSYDTEQAVLPPRADLDAIDFLVQSVWSRRQDIADAIEIDTVSLTPGEVDALLVFLRALTDPASIDLRHMVPYQVPSGLPVWD